MLPMIQRCWFYILALYIVQGSNYNYSFDGAVQTMLLDLHGSTYTKKNYQKLSEFFSFLNPRIVPPSKPRSLTQIPTLKPCQLFEHMSANFTPLVASLFGLTLGKKEHDMENITSGVSNNGYQLEYMALCFAADVLLRATSHQLHSRK